MGLGALKDDLVKRRARNPMRELLAKDSGPLRNGSRVVPFAALACDHKNGSMPCPMCVEQKRNERRPPLRGRHAVKVDPRIRCRLPPLHARELSLVHANRRSAGVLASAGRSRGLLANAKFRNLEGFPCLRSRSPLRSFLRDLSCRLLAERLGAARNALPKTLLLGAQGARLSTHCRPARGAHPVGTAPSATGERLAHARLPSTGTHANPSEAAVGRRFIPSWRPAASSGHLHPWSGQRSRHASGA